MILLLLLSVLAASSLAQQKENPTWFIPSQEKPSTLDDQSFCEGELAQTSGADLYQTRTSEILLPQDLPPAVCIIFPLAPGGPEIRCREPWRMSQPVLLLQTAQQEHPRPSTQPRLVRVPCWLYRGQSGRHQA